MFCRNCGTQNQDGAGFCCSCGAPLSSGGPAGGGAAAKAKNINVKLIGIVAAVVVVLFVAFKLLFGGGGGPEKSATKFVDSIFKGDGKAIVNMIPDKVVEEIMDEEDMTKKEMIEELNDGLEYIKDDMDDMYDKWSVKCKVLDTEDFSKRELRDLADRYEDSYDIDVKAANTIVATGGFIQNEDMLREYYSGAVMYGTGNQYNDGAGIKLAQSAGAQMGKNFSTSINESGACNMKSSARFVSLEDCNATPVFSLPLFGGLMVNKHGSRFMDEGTMAKHTMYCGEPLLREGVYYMVIDDGLIQELSTTPIMDFISEDAFGNMAPGVQMGFEGKTLTALPDMVQQGIDEGWIWKADTAEALAEAVGMENLVDTLATYNGYCAAGVDDEMFKEAQFLRAVDTGALYVVELNIAAWVTLGGIKTDGFCRAVDAEANPIPGLLVAGVDGDFWAVPYFEGGSAQGFCVGSGYLAGITAAQA